MMESSFKNNFISYNGVGFLTESSGFTPGLEFVNYVALTRRTNNFMIRKARHYYQLNTFLKNTQIIYVTSNDQTLKQFKENPLTPTVVYPVTNNKLAIGPSKTNNSLVTLLFLTNLQTDYLIGYCLAYYKIITYLIINLIFKTH